jgi:hypothetical protein
MRSIQKRAPFYGEILLGFNILKLCGNLAFG